MSDDQWLREALEATDAAPRPGFRAELRSRVSDEWHGREVLTPAAHDRATGRPWWTIGAAAAAVTALVVTGLVWITRSDDDSRIAPPTDSGVAPVTASVPQPGEVTTPVTGPTATPTPGPTTTPTTRPGGPCFAGLDGEAAATSFAEALVAARFRGAPTAACLDGVPDQFTDTAGACWDECTLRTFPRDGLAVSEGVTSARDTFWSIGLPVTYGNPYVDVTEFWQLRPDGDGWAATLSSIEQPVMTRTESLDAVNAYLAALAAQDWDTAADFHFRDGINPDERGDLQDLAPNEYTTTGVAAALARWCAEGCDTTPATLDALSFDGGYALVRNGQQLRISWYEGVYGMSGTPPRAVTPEDGRDLLAGWPEAPAPPTVPLDGIPYLVPTNPMPGADQAVSREWSSPPDTASYGQMWVDPADPTLVIQIDTYPGQSALPENTRGAVAPGWDDPRASWSSIGHVRLTLGEPGGYVTVEARGVPEWELLDAVGGMERAGVGPGWELADANLQLVADGWDTGYASRIIRWPDAELIVARAGTELFDTAQQFDRTVRLVELARGPGVVFESDELVAVAWNVSDDVSALFGYRGTAEEALSIVNGLVSTSREGWLETAPLDPSPADGCAGLFC